MHAGFLVWLQNAIFPCLPFFFFGKLRLQNILFHGAGWQLEANVFVKQTLKSAEFVTEARYQHKQFYQSMWNSCNNLEFIIPERSNSLWSILD